MYLEELLNKMDISVSKNFSLEINDELTIKPIAYLESKDGRLKMLVVKDIDEIDGYTGKILDMGYGCTEMPDFFEPDDSTEEVVRAMVAEWLGEDEID